MKKMTCGKEKLAHMISLLKEANGAPVTTGVLMHELECNRNSVNNYYKRCLESGNNVKKVNVGHETGYYIEESETVYDPLTSDMVYKYMIMQNVVPGADSIKELMGLDIQQKDECIEDIGGIRQISVSKYYDLVQELIDEGELVVYDGKYYPARKNIPVSWRVDEKTAFEYMDILSMMPPGHHSQKLMDSVYRKISAIYEYDDKDYTSYKVVGRAYSTLNRIHELISVLKSVDYINHLIKIKYTGNTGKNSECIIAVGLVVYSVEKDKIYLIGERRGSGSDVRREKRNKELTVFIDIEKVKEVRSEKGINRSYQNKRFMDLYNRMFSISNSRIVEENEERVTVKFSDDEYIKDRIQNLCEYRKASGPVVESGEDGLVYSDMIVGLDDFIKFLRQFTGNYEILNSERLESKKKEYVEKMLAAYTEDME